MKNMKIAIIATIITCIIIVSCSFVLTASAEMDNCYACLTIVINTQQIENNLWIISCQDKDGNYWTFFDDNNSWTKGDIANLLMYCYDDDITHNEIIDVYREGYTDNINLFLSLIGWRQ